VERPRAPSRPPAAVSARPAPPPWPVLPDMRTASPAQLHHGRQQSLS